MLQGKRMSGQVGCKVGTGREDGRSKGRKVEWSRGEMREKAEGRGCSKDKVERVEKMQ